MITKRFTITSKFLNDIKSCTKNYEQTLDLLNVMFKGDFRFTKAKLWISTMEIETEPFIIQSPAGYITVERIK